MSTPEQARFPACTRRLRLGFVGGGQGSFIGEVHAMGARLSNRWEVTAGALSSSPDKALASGRAWLLAEERIYSDYRHMAAAEAQRSDGIDAVVIATPNHTHFAIAKVFMQHGIHVICDKPLCNTLEEAEELVALQRETGVVFAVSYCYASHAMVRQMREMVDAGALGRLCQVHVEYFQDWAIDLPTAADGGTPWRLDTALSGHSFTTADIGTHAHHLACFATGLDLHSLRADFHTVGNPKPLEDTAFIQLRFAGGVPGTLMTSQAAAGTHCDLRIRLFGDKASLEWRQEDPEHLCFAEPGKPKVLMTRADLGCGPSVQRLQRMRAGFPEGLTDAWANLYSEIAVAIQAQQQGVDLAPGLVNFPTVKAGLDGVRFTDAAIRSNAADGAWVEL